MAYSVGGAAPPCRSFSPAPPGTRRDTCGPSRFGCLVLKRMSVLLHQLRQRLVVVPALRQGSGPNSVRQHDSADRSLRTRQFRIRQRIMWQHSTPPRPRQTTEGQPARRHSEPAGSCFAQRVSAIRPFSVSDLDASDAGLERKRQARIRRVAPKAAASCC